MCRARWGGTPDAVFPSRRDEAAAPAGSAHRRLPGPRTAVPAGDGAHDDVRPGAEGARPVTTVLDRPAVPSYSVISLIFAVTSGSGGAADESAMAFVMSPCSLILPAMNACMAACGFWSTIIARDVS